MAEIFVHLQFSPRHFVMMIRYDSAQAVVMKRDLLTPSVYVENSFGDVVAKFRVFPSHVQYLHASVFFTA